MEAKLNNELIRAVPEDEKKADGPKRNSKDELITKILQIAEVNDITLQHSDSNWPSYWAKSSKPQCGTRWPDRLVRNRVRLTV